MFDAGWVPCICTWIWPVATHAGAVNVAVTWVHVAAGIETAVAILAPSELTPESNQPTATSHLDVTAVVTHTHAVTVYWRPATTVTSSLAKSLTGSVPSGTIRAENEPLCFWVEDWVAVQNDATHGLMPVSNPVFALSAVVGSPDTSDVPDGEDR